MDKVTKMLHGAVKVIDLSSGASLEGQVNIIGEGVQAAYSADGDVVLHTLDLSMIYVNEEYFKRTKRRKTKVLKAKNVLST